MKRIVLDLDSVCKDAEPPQAAPPITQDVEGGKTPGVNATREFCGDGKPLPCFGYEERGNWLRARWRPGTTYTSIGPIAHDAVRSASPPWRQS